MIASGRLVWLPPILLAVVACAQIALTRTTLLSSWKGGGFGMFATLDGGQHRSMRIVVFSPDRSEELDVPLSLEHLAARIQLYPGKEWLNQFARRVAEREQRRGRPVSQVRIELWRTDYQPGTLQANTRRLVEHTRAVD
jgi:hypothetical protein